jgi:sugar phosphate permease
MAPELGWRRAFWAPAVILALIAVCYVIWVRNQPRDAGVDEIVESSTPSETSREQPAAEPGTLGLVRIIFKDGAIWVSAGMFFCLKITRYAFMFWLPVYMTERLRYPADEAGYTSALFELMGFVGALAAGYASDRWMGSRRFPVGTIMMFGLAAVTFLHPTLSATGRFGNALGIALIGMMTYGPDTLLSGAAAQDLGSRRGAGTAAGLIDGVGSIGQLFSPYLVAYITHQYGWDALFRFFVVIAVSGACLGLTHWNHRVAPATER